MRKIMVFGTFDIFHKGHKNFLSQAKKYGDYLVVVVARDKTVLAVKGEEPKNNEKQRLAAVIKDNLADKVVLGKLNNKYGVIRELEPDIICLGYDQQAFTEKLTEKLREFGRTDTKIIRLKPYYPEKYKSSKIKNK